MVFKVQITLKCIHTTYYYCGLEMSDPSAIKPEDCLKFHKNKEK